MLAKLLPFIAIVDEYERVAIFRVGRIAGYKGPGIVWRWPFIDRFVRVDLRIVTIDVQPQECMTRDNIPVTVNAVVYYRVEHPDKSIVEVVDHHTATIEIAQTTLRTIIGQRSLDDLLSKVDEAADALQSIIDEATDEWGVKVTRVEIKDIQIPDSMKRAMAKEAEAERERRAMVVRALGEQEASAKLVEAAQILEQSDYGFKMRYLQTLNQISENGNTVVFAPTDQVGTTASAAVLERTRSS